VRILKIYYIFVETKQLKNNIMKLDYTNKLFFWEQLVITISFLDENTKYYYKIGA